MRENRRNFWTLLVLKISLLVLLCFSDSLNGQAIKGLGEPILQEKKLDELQINFAEKANLSLTALVQWFAEETGRTITSDSSKFPGKAESRIIVYGDIHVNQKTMFELVQSILKNNGFAIVDSEVENIYQVVPLPDVRPNTKLIKPGEEKNFPRGEYVTGVFTLSHLSPSDASDYVRQLLFGGDSGQSTSIATVPNLNILIVTETAARMSRVVTLLRELDAPQAKLERHFYDVQNLEADELKQQLESILSDSASADATRGASASVKINAIQRTNQLLLSGSNFQILETLELIEKLDVANANDLRTYQFRFISAGRIDQLIRDSLGSVSAEELDRLYRATVDQQSNGLVVMTRPEIHQRIERLRNQLDVEDSAATERSPVRFYTLKNVKAIDILDTLTSVVGRVSAQSGQQNQRNDSLSFTSQIEDSFATTGLGQGTGDTIIDPFADLRRRDQQDRRRNELLGQSLGGLTTGAQGGSQSRASLPQGTPSLTGNQFPGAGSAGSGSVIPGEANITVNEATNTLIVVAEPEIQRLYADLIQRLDVRRPQVLIEVFVVTISDDDVESFGIEISGGDRTDGNSQAFAFSSFGLSAVDGTNGFLSLTPGLGFNGTLINPETADVVIQALAQNDKARVVAAPRILVNDNATGVLSSTQEVPFTGTSIGNAAATTSLGGFAQAGTTLSVTPQISDDNYLNLEFDITVNDFLGPAISDAVPPERVTDQITSQVSIPDGHTVIVGGLKGRSDAHNFTGLPFLQNIPIIKRLASSTSNGTERDRLFVFIKPIILRDDKFKDLRVLSSIERREAELPSDLPYSEPVLIR